LYYSTTGLRVIKKKKKRWGGDLEKRIHTDARPVY